MLIPAAVGYAVAVYAGSQIAGAVAAMMLSAAIAQRQRQRAERQQRAAWNASTRDQLITVKGGVNPRPILYGRTCVGGQVIYAESFGARKEHLVLVIALAHGEVDSIESVYFNDQALTIDGSNNVTNAPYAVGIVGGDTQQFTVPGSPYQVTLPYVPTGTVLVQNVTTGMGGGDAGAPTTLTEGTDFTRSGAVLTFAPSFAGALLQASYSVNASQSFVSIWRYTGAPGQDISSVMMGLGAPSWTAADKCQGMALLVVKMSYVENMWPTGVPNIKAVVRGRKVYDPRTGTTAYSTNAALVARDYLTFQYGVGAANGKIDDNATIAAANLCDEDVEATAGVWQDRYTAGGVISTGDDRLANLAKIEQSMAGRVNYSSGQWRIRAGGYTTPALLLNEGRLADGEIAILPYASRRDLINGAKATYLSEAAGWVEDQAPEWSSAAFIAADGGVPMTAAFGLPLVTDSLRAQRLAKIAVYRSREALTIRCRCNFTTYAWQVGDMVSVTLARYGFAAKPFRIVERGFSVEGALNYTLREEPNGIYDWALGEASVLTGAANTTLPNPGQVGMPAITGITSAQWLYKAGDGTFVARIRVAVTPPNDEYVTRGGKLQLQYKRGDWTVDWLLVEADGNATQIWIDPAFDAQNYIIRVRAKNAAGYVSAWSEIQVHTCSGRPGQVVNLLLNSNCAQDLGFPGGVTFYSDTRALRHWLPGGNPGSFGRNYDDGKTWNIGKGGWCIYIPSNTVGHYAYVYQDVPVVPGVAYEASISVSTHRGRSYVQVQYLNAAKDTVLGNPSDSYNSGASIDGDAYDTSTHRRLWCTGTAPANTAYARFIALIECTAQSSPYPFSAWSKAMLCVAPDGVTRATATPWVSDELPFPRGVGEPVTVSASWAGSYWRFMNPAPGTHQYIVFEGSYASPLLTLNLKAGDAILIDARYWGTYGFANTPTPAFKLALLDVVVVGSGKSPFHTGGPSVTGNLEGLPSLLWNPQATTDNTSVQIMKQYVATSDQTIEIYASGGARGFQVGDSGGIGTSAIQLRVEKVKA